MTPEYSEGCQTRRVYSWKRYLRCAHTLRIGRRMQKDRPSEAKCQTGFIFLAIYKLSTPFFFGPSSNQHPLFVTSLPSQQHSSSCPYRDQPHHSLHFLTMVITNQAVVFLKPATGFPVAGEHLVLRSLKLKHELQENEILLRNLFISPDPGKRSWISSSFMMNDNPQAFAHFLLLLITFNCQSSAHA